MENSLKNKLKNQYENLSETPSKNIWERIENELEGENKLEEKPIFFFKYWKMASIILLLISLGLSFKIYFNKNFNLFENQIVKKEKNHSDVLRNSNGDATHFQTNPIENQVVASSENQGGKKEIQHKNIQENKSKNELKVVKVFSDNQPTNSIAEISKKEIKIQDSPKIFKEQNSIENKQVIAQNTVKKPKAKYVTAEDLLFEREASKTLKEQENNRKSLGANTDFTIKKPKEIKILGFTVYFDDKE